MLKNYLKIAWRSFTRNKISSTINIIGLTIGFTCIILIGMYVKDEYGYDDFFKDADRVYRVNIDGKMGNDEFTVGHTPPPAGAALINNFPEIESYTRIYDPGNEIIHYQHNGQNLSLNEENLLSVDSNFLEFFDYPLIEGNAGSCLNDANSVVLTQKAAKKYFGNTSPIGQTLIFDEYSKPFTVKAVLKDLPKQSSLQFDMLQSNIGMPPVKRFSWSWVWLQMSTYVKLKPNIPASAKDINQLEAKFPKMVSEQAASAFNRIGQPFDEFKKKGGRWDLHLQPLKRIHLYSSNIQTNFFAQGDIKNVYIFSAIALFIIILACVNFMNLATAQSAKRAKEVGVRKVLGSERKNLIAQFITEAILYSLFAMILALFIVVAVLPAFNQLSGKLLGTEVFYHVSTWISIILLIIFTGLLAGSYPAFFITAVKPVNIFRGGNIFGNKTGTSFTRNALVVFQFTISTILIICTIVVYKQLIYSQSKDLGFKKENILVIVNADRLGTSEESLRQELIALPEVKNATISTSVPTRNPFGDFYTPIANGDNINSTDGKITLSSFTVDEDFVPTFDLKILNGRQFSKKFNDSASVLLNETAAKQIGWKEVIGKSIAYPGNGNQKFKVIGIVKDFNTESIHSKIAPFALFYNTSKSYNTGQSYISVRIKPGDYHTTINHIESKWKSFMPDTPFEYSFIDSEFDALYRTDRTLSKVFTVFTLISVLIACLGLLGLAIYTAESRTKEIGIRKVLGASVQNVVTLLSKDFIKLVGIAVIISFPVAWYVMHSWLQDFAYRTDVSWWIFALAALITAVIALITVSFQSMKAALANPVNSLRSE
ncbi:ABC transporter permease [Mucilaginibacter segetis]|uniref:ABC transporter permease n=1 Tax=Mucilaginibacter segetis TaxID=2793071 RepID=A0A934PU80_9SPHI|nr:ABC transporter permease [Mucilaginibacter segetis]MBK0379175.1 ABC transporter permease [Mucilaginibacter segetis]